MHAFSLLRVKLVFGKENESIESRTKKHCLKLPQKSKNKKVERFKQGNKTDLQVATRGVVQ